MPTVVPRGTIIKNKPAANLIESAAGMRYNKSDYLQMPSYAAASSKASTSPGLLISTLIIQPAP